MSQEAIPRIEPHGGLRYRYARTKEKPLFLPKFSNLGRFLGFSFLCLVLTVETRAEDAITRRWHTDYAAAVEAAKEQGKLLFVFFHQPENNAARRAFESRTLASPEIIRQLHDFQCAMLPMDASIIISGKPVRLLDHPAFSEMQHRQGVSILDFANPGTKHYGCVVNTFPFDEGRYYSARALKTILNLPPGTLTQRTMVYAVRMHPERPASTRGKLDPVLLSEAQSHSHHQARIHVQGHHGWGHRFQRILSRLFGRGSDPVEVVAESWPGQGLVEAAVDCVDSWRQSPGHWQAVKSNRGAYAYDIKRGNNGIWYATGIFASYHR